MSPENDPSLMQDFLTEAAELIGKLDVDLVKLEESPSAGPESSELLNSIFRALHTVKGAAGFLGLEQLIRFAHAAEDALNKLRKGEVAVSPAIIDALLQSVDVLRGMTAALGANKPVPECPDSLLTQLHQIANSDKSATPTAAPVNPASGSAGSATDTGTAAPIKSDSTRIRTLSLPSQKQDLVGFMVADMQESTRQIEQELRGARSESDRAVSASAMAALAEPMAKTLEFFDLLDLASLVRTFGHASTQLTQLDTAIADELLVRLAAVKHLVDLQAVELTNSRAIDWPLVTLIERIRALSSNQPMPEEIAGRHGGNIEAVLKLDGVLESDVPTPMIVAAHPEAPSAGVETPERRSDDRRQGDRRQGDRRAEGASVSPAPAGDSTIRVEVSRLEALLNLVGQLVLNKNRVLGLSRRMRAGPPAHELLEEIGSAANELDRLTAPLPLANVPLPRYPWPVGAL